MQSIVGGKDVFVGATAGRLRGGGKVTRDGFIENNIPREKEFAVEITYQPTEAVLDISNKDGLEAMCGALSTNFLRLMDEALAAEYP